MTTPTTDPTLDPLRATTTLQEYRFRSQVPLIGPLIVRFRELWNGVATKWYVRPLIQQQNEINQQFVATLAAQATGLRDVASRLVVNEERLANSEERLANSEERLANSEERLANSEERLANSEVHLHRQDNRQQDHDGWLIDLDHEQVTLIRSQAELTVRLIQVERLLMEIEQRLAKLDPVTGTDLEGS